MHIRPSIHAYIHIAMTDFRREGAKAESIPINPTTRHHILKCRYDQNGETFPNAFFSVLYASLALIIECSYFRPNHTRRHVFQQV